MCMKKVLVVLLSFLLTVTAVPVAAAGVYNPDAIKFTYSGHTFQRESETVYTLSATKRLSSGEIIMPETQTLTLSVEDGAGIDLSGISAKMKSEAGKKDIRLTVVSSSAKEAKININFSHSRVSTSLNMTDAILIYNKEGMEIRSVLFAYDTPYFQDEHESGFNSLTAWAGEWDVMDGESFKTSGLLDVYQGSRVLTYTYKAQGSQGVKAFHLNPEGNFTFLNGKTVLTNINHSAKAVHKIQIKCKKSKPDYLEQMKEDLEDSLGRYGQNTIQYVFDDIVVEYADGCLIGGALDPIYLGYQATLRILGKTSLKTSGRSTTSVKLTWQKMSGVDGYRIYRSTKKNSGYKKIKTLSSKYTSYQDKKRKSATAYYYKIRPYRNVVPSGKTKKVVFYGAYSAVHKSGTRPKKASFTMKKRGRRLKITNKKVSGCTGYRIYLKSGKKGKYKRVKQLNGSRKRTWYTKKLRKKKVYYVRIRAYKQISGKKYFGSYSKSKKIRI